MRLSGTAAQQARWLPALASGDVIGCLAVAEGVGSELVERPRTWLADGRVHGAKLAVDGGAAHLGVVSADSATGPALCLVDLAAAGVAREPVDSVDPSRKQARLRFEAAPAERLDGPGVGADALARLLDRAAVLIAFEQLGGAERAFEITREFALGRYAFGRPIASFQAIKHRLADLYVAIELARSNAYYGAWALGDRAPTSCPSPRASPASPRATPSSSRRRR